MSLLQDPIKELDQIDWYLENKNLEKFPGAFNKAAGNLCRQILEQILFILAFYSGLPKKEYMKKNLQLLMADRIWTEIKKTKPNSNLTYLEEARKKSPRIRKFAKYPRSIDKWRRDFNEFSHFKNPASQINAKEKNIKEFVKRMRGMLDSEDNYLIIGAVNELISNGFVKAEIGNDPDNKPAIVVDALVYVNDINWEDGRFSILSKPVSGYVVPSDIDVSILKWKKRPIMVQNTKMTIGIRMVTTHGIPLDPSNMVKSLLIVCDTPRKKELLNRRMAKYGVKVHWEPPK